MRKPYIAIRINAPATKDGGSRTGWIVREVLDSEVFGGDLSPRAFVWQHKPGPDELFREYPRDTINVVAGFDVTVKEYEKVLRSIGIAA
jgi:hypothetical protein